MANTPIQRRTWMTWTTWGLIFLALIGAIGLLSIWVLPSLLTDHPSNGLTAVQRLTAVNQVRSTPNYVLSCDWRGRHLFFTGRTFLLSRDTQVADRYTKAVSQIGDNDLGVRIGGLYALEQIGRGYPVYRETVVWMSGALVRHRSKEPRALGDEPGEDVYTALRVISRIAPMTEVTVSLRGADLYCADLRMMRGVRVHKVDGKVDAELKNAKLPDDWERPTQLNRLDPPVSNLS